MSGGVSIDVVGLASEAPTRPVTTTLVHPREPTEKYSDDASSAQNRTTAPSPPLVGSCGFDVAIENVFQHFLATGDVLVGVAFFEHVFFEVFQGDLTGLNPGTDAAIPRGVAFLDEVAEDAVRLHLGRDFQSASEGVHPTDVGMEEIDRLEALAANFGVKVQSAGPQSALIENDEHHLCRQIQVGRELVGIPAEHQVTRIGIDRPQHARCAGRDHVVHHGVPGQRRVIRLQVQLHLVQQIILTQEVDARCRVEVVLVRGRLLRLGFDEELAGESDLHFVVVGEVEELREVIEFAFHVGVQERTVAFATAPEHIVFASEFFGHFQGLFDLSGRKGEDVGIARSRGTVNVTLVAEEVGRTPEQFDTGTLLLLLEDGDDAIEVSIALAEVRAFRCYVAIVEAVELDAELLEKLEHHPRAGDRHVHRIGPIFPGPNRTTGAERIAARASQGMPVGNGKTEVILHRFTGDDSVGVVVTESERVGRCGTFVGDFRNVRKKAHGTDQGLEERLQSKVQDRKEQGGRHPLVVRMASQPATLLVTSDIPHRHTALYCRIGTFHSRDAHPSTRVYQIVQEMDQWWLDAVETGEQALAIRSDHVEDKQISLLNGPGQFLSLADRICTVTGRPTQGIRRLRSRPMSNRDRINDAVQGFVQPVVNSHIQMQPLSIRPRSTQQEPRTHRRRRRDDAASWLHRKRYRVIRQLGLQNAINHVENVLNLRNDLTYIGGRITASNVEEDKWDSFHFQLAKYSRRFSRGFLPCGCFEALSTNVKVCSVGDQSEGLSQSQELLDVVGGRSELAAERVHGILIVDFQPYIEPGTRRIFRQLADFRLGIGQKGDNSLTEGISDVVRCLDGIGVDTAFWINARVKGQIKFRRGSHIKASTEFRNSLNNTQFRTGFDGVVNLHILPGLNEGEIIFLDLMEIVHQHRPWNPLKGLEQFPARRSKMTPSLSQNGQPLSDIGGRRVVVGGRHIFPGHQEAAGRGQCTTHGGKGNFQEFASVELAHKDFLNAICFDIPSSDTSKGLAFSMPTILWVFSKVRRPSRHPQLGLAMLSQRAGAEKATVYLLSIVKRTFIVAPIYLDYNATTPIDPEVFRAMLPYLGDLDNNHRGIFGNPSSTHALGRAAHDAVDHSRAQVAALLGAQPDEILFTGGGTEASNHAIKGVFFARQTGNFLTRLFRRAGCHVITSAIEHPATTNPINFLQSLGCRVTVVGVNGVGRVDPDDVRRAIAPDTVLISVMHSNNEVGTLQPIAELGKIARERGVLMHTDVAQSLGKVSVNVDDLHVDLVTVAGHKLYAPKGIGVLYVRRGVKLVPLLHGAGHENGQRAGTENVPTIVALGKACEIARATLPQATVRLTALRDRLHHHLAGRVTLNGCPTNRLPNTLNVNFTGHIGAELLAKVPGVAASTGSACHEGRVTQSAVLCAMRVPPEVGKGAVRLTVGRFSTEAEIDSAAKQLLAAAG